MTYLLHRGEFPPTASRYLMRIIRVQGVECLVTSLESRCDRGAMTTIMRIEPPPHGTVDTVTETMGAERARFIRWRIYGECIGDVSDLLREGWKEVTQADVDEIRNGVMR